MNLNYVFEEHTMYLRISTQNDQNQDIFYKKYCTEKKKKKKMDS